MGNGCNHRRQHGVHPKRMRLPSLENMGATMDVKHDLDHVIKTFEGVECLNKFEECVARFYHISVTLNTIVVAAEQYFTYTWVDYKFTINRILEHAARALSFDHEHCSSEKGGRAGNRAVASISES
jgi:hypothetical protein